MISVVKLDDVIKNMSLSVRRTAVSMAAGVECQYTRIPNMILSMRERMRTRRDFSFLRGMEEHL